MNTNHYLDPLSDAASVAVIGASGTMGKWGYGIMSVLLGKGGREIYPVNKKGGEVLGVKAYRSILDVPVPVELAVIVTPVPDTPAAMEDCVRKGVKLAIIITGGFSEASEEGARIEREVAEIARRGGLRFVGPNCMGHFDAHTNFFTIPFKNPVKKGPVSIITQSGNSGIAVFARGWDVGMGFRKFFNSGNEADIHFEDYLEYLGRDDETGVILCYVEGFREGRRFLELAREITKKKPVVVLKAGHTDDGARAARSHSAALSGSDIVAGAAFRQAGVIRVEELGDLSDTALALVGQPLPRGRRVGVISMGGGLGVISTDLLRKRGLEIARLAPETIERLNAVMADRWSHGNPVDPGGDPVIYPCIWPLIEDDNVDAVMVVGGIGMVGGLTALMPVPDMLKDKYDRFMRESEEAELGDVDRMLDMMKRYGKPVVAASMLSGSVVKSRVYEKLESNHVLPYPTPERAARALARLVEYSEYRGVA